MNILKRRENPLQKFDCNIQKQRSAAEQIPFLDISINRFLMKQKRKKYIFHYIMMMMIFLLEFFHSIFDLHQKVVLFWDDDEEEEDSIFDFRWWWFWLIFFWKSQKWFLCVDSVDSGKNCILWMIFSFSYWKFEIGNEMNQNHWLIEMKWNQ